MWCKELQLLLIITNHINGLEASNIHTVLTFAHAAYHVLLLYVIVGYAQNSADTGGRNEDVIGSGEKFIKGDAGNIAEAAIISGEALADRSAQLQNPPWFFAIKTQW